MNTFDKFGAQLAAALETQKAKAQDGLAELEARAGEEDGLETIEVVAWAVGGAVAIGGLWMLVEAWATGKLSGLG